MWNGQQGELDFRASVHTRPMVARRLSRFDWLRELEPATEPFRQQRAREYIRAGERAHDADARHEVDANDERAEAFAWILNAGSVSPLPDAYYIERPSRDPLPVPQWHYSRAEAQRERWTLLNTCGAKQVTTKCDCGQHKSHSTTIRCDHWRLCVTCRGRRKQRYQARFEVGRARARKRLHQQIDARRFKREGRWSEKLLTLTVPHGDSPADDIAELRRAWPAMRRSIARYLKRKGCESWKEVPYWRSLEVTSSGSGHAHFHVWLLCPYLPQSLVAHWWGRALSESYRAHLPRTAVDWSRIASRDAKEFKLALRGHGTLYAPVVDLRAANDEARGELVKYLVKDCVGDPKDGQHIEPKVYARIYAALDGARAVATSTHLCDDKKEPRSCESCGALLSRKIEAVPLDETPRAAPFT